MNPFFAREKLGWARRAKRPRILVAEDDVEMRRVVIESLRADDYDVVDIPDGGQLLIRITNHYRLRPDPEPIDLIVTDIRMPVVSGMEVAQSLRDADWATPIVIMTAFADPEIRARAESLEAVLLDKPVRIELLRTVVRSLLALASRCRT